MIVTWNAIKGATLLYTVLKRGFLMKKILIIISIILSCFVFYNAYDLNNRQLFNDTCNLYMLPNDPRSLDSFFVNYQTEEDRKNILVEMENTAKDTGSSIAYVTNTLNEDGVYTDEMYVYLPPAYTLNVFLENVNEVIDFSVDDEQKYYTSDEKDDERYNLLTSYNHNYFNGYQSLIRVAPFCQSFDKKVINDSLVFYIRSDNIEQFIQTFRKNMQETGSAYSDQLLTESGHFDENTSQTNSQKITIGLCSAMIAYLVAYCLMVSKGRKKIGVYRLEGYSPFSVALRFYGLTMCLSIAVYGLAALVLCMLFTSTVHVQYFVLYKELFYYYMLFISGNLIAFIGTWIYIQYTTRYVAGDFDAGLRQTIRINYVIKVLVALVLLGGFSQCVKESIPMIRYYQTAVKYRGMFEETQIMDRIPMVMKMQEFGTKLYDIGYYSNFDDYQNYSNKDNPLMYKYLGDRFLEEYYMSEPFLICNGNYIELMGNTILDTDGNPVDIHVDSNDYLLVPEKYRSLDLAPYSHTYGITEVIYVQHTGDYVDVNMLNPKNPMYDPIIRLSNQWNYNFNVNQLLLPKNETYDRQYYEQLMAEYNVKEDDLAFMNTSYYYDTYLQKLEQSLIDFLYVLSLYTFVFGMLLYQSTNAYVIKNKKRLAISYLCGIPRIKRYSDLLLQNISLYLIISIGSISIMHHTVSDTLLFVSFFGLLELFIQIIMLMKMERISISNALKGE